MLNKIKIVLFDLGGVLIKIHPNIFYKCTPLVAEALYNDMHIMEEKLGLGYEPAEKIIRDFLSKHNLLSEYDHMIKTFTEAYLGGKISETADLIALLKKNNHQIGLLSNTNHLHFQHVCPWFNGFKDFDKLYLSYVLHLLKPDPKIFQYMIDDLKFKPEEIFYIDDSAENIHTAQTLGIKTLLVTSNQPEAEKIKKELIMNNHC